MAQHTERVQDTRISVWDTEPAGERAESHWQQPLKAWQRLASALRPARSATRPDPTAAERTSAEMTTLPAGGRGQALREAHRALRLQLRRHRPLRALLPHLLYVEQALGRQGSQALLDMPLWVMQRGLQQLNRLPWDDHPEPALHPLQTLKLRLIEALETRSLHAAVVSAEPEGEDSFSGSLDSQFSTRGPLSLPPAGIVVDDMDSADPGPHPAASAQHPFDSVRGTAHRRR